MGALREPGWDHWEALLPPYSYFSYDLSINNVRRHSLPGSATVTTWTAS